MKLMFDCLVADDLSCGSLNSAGLACHTIFIAGQYSYRRLDFFILVFIIPSELTGWYTHLITAAAREIKLDGISVDSVVFIMYSVFHDAYTCKVDTFTGRKRFLNSILQYIYQLISKYMQYVVLEFYIASGNIYPNMIIYRFWIFEIYI